MSNISSDTARQGLTIAPGVVETIISLAVQQVEGVAGLSTITAEGVLKALRAQRPSPGVLVLAEDDGRLIVDVHLQVFYGYPLPEIAAAVRHAVADALSSQVSIQVSEVNVVIEAIQFAGLTDAGHRRRQP
ncbi:MAG: Asp23/Gls24 family envelope stress response protein [Coriobacteriales bacterium]|jgi:uncharacterized alkaline shock family protein YloU|nr:Asp23/Gls24 family envelope stress response protein [Coriobacteriales bacterium]